ncbi:MAG: Asp23/Gls24 family envelope stress response protein [Roseiflexaceae bacterium]
MVAATGSVIVAPNVLVRLVSLAIREVPGVARLGGVPYARAGLRGGKSGAGVVAQIAADGVSVDCYLIAEAGTNLLELGIAVQATVAAVIQELAGMSVREVNVYIQDVEAGSG